MRLTTTTALFARILTASLFTLTKMLRNSTNIDNGHYVSIWIGRMFNMSLNKHGDTFFSFLLFVSNYVLDSNDLDFIRIYLANNNKLLIGERQKHTMRLHHCTLVFHLLVVLWFVCFFVFVFFYSRHPISVHYVGVTMSLYSVKERSVRRKKNSNYF